jgi:hypothetical protein
LTFINFINSPFRASLETVVDRSLGHFSLGTVSIVRLTTLTLLGIPFVSLAFAVAGPFLYSATSDSLPVARVLSGLVARSVSDDSFNLIVPSLLYCLPMLFPSIVMSAQRWMVCSLNAPSQEEITIQFGPTWDEDYASTLEPWELMLLQRDTKQNDIF